jgi:hypothetical protein
MDVDYLLNTPPNVIHMEANAPHLILRDLGADDSL